MTRTAWIPSVLLLSAVLAPGRADAQEHSQVSPAPTEQVGFDSVTSVDTYAAHDGHASGAVFDLSGVWRVAPALQVSVRPVVVRKLDGTWDANVYELSVRYDRPGRVLLRVEAGYLPSPIGILPLESRADQNPLITSAQNYDAWLPFFEHGTPWVQLGSGQYPLAAQVTVAGKAWDLRGGILGSSTARARPLTGGDNPPATPHLALGGGLTPHVGLRLGASFERGVYAKAYELADPATGDRSATIVGLDADYSVGYTRLYADWIQGTFDRAAGSTTGRALTVTGVRTLSPRWYLAARLQRQTTTDALVWPDETDPVLAALTRPESALNVEAVAGYRVTADVTLRAGYHGDRDFGEAGLEPQAVCSIVWTRRWH
jgi:hypothetical protein